MFRIEFIDMLLWWW